MNYGEGKEQEQPRPGSTVPDSALQDSEERYRILADGVRDAVLHLAGEGWTIQACNAAAVKIFGGSGPAELLGLDALQLSAKTQCDGRLSLPAAIERRVLALREGRQQFDWTCRRLDGHPFSAQVLIDRAPRAGGFELQVTVRDTSGQAGDDDGRVPYRLRHAQELAQHIPEVLIMVDAANTRKLYVSPAYQSVWGRSCESLMANPGSWLEAVHDEDRERVAALDASLPETGHAGFDHEFRVVRPNGTVRWVNARGYPVFNEAGGYVRLAQVAADITPRKEVEEAMRRANRALRALRGLAQALQMAQDESSFVERVCRVVVELAGYRLACVAFDGPEPAGFSPVAHAGARDAFAELAGSSMEIAPGRALALLAMQEGGPYLVEDAAADPRWQESAAALGYRSALGLPLGSAEAVIGAVCIFAGERNAFDAEEIHLLLQLADELALGVTSLRSRAEIERGTARLRVSMESTIAALAATLELRDAYTAGHQRHVAQLSAALARELGCQEVQVHGIELAATVHDLGKIQVPAEILAKPAKLSKLEYELVKTHAQAGYELLKDIDFPWPIAELVWQHHERMDGSGYPRGLRGEQILLGARIIAVADTVEAMVSHRPYRASLGMEMTMAEMRRGRGTSYDAEVVDACLRLFEEKSFAFTP